jgi:hypothetical protein
VRGPCARSGRQQNERQKTRSEKAASPHRLNALDWSDAPLFSGICHLIATNMYG